MKEYMEKLYHKLHEAMEKPVTLGSAEEVMVYADTICALHKLGDDHFRESTKMMEFTEADAKAWTARMKNADGTTGPHWTMEQTTAVAESMGIQAPVVPRWAWGVTMNMMYSDYYPVAVEFGLNRLSSTPRWQRRFCSTGRTGGNRKLMAYYEHIAK